VLAGQQVRHVDLGAEERGGGEAADEDDGGQSAPGGQRAEWDERAEGEERDDRADDREEPGGPAGELCRDVDREHRRGDEDGPAEPADVGAGRRSGCHHRAARRCCFRRLPVGALDRRRAEHPQGREEQDGREHDEPDHAEEHPVPGELLGDDAGEERSDERGDDPRGGEPGEDPRVERGRVDACDEDVERDRHRPGAEGLHESPGDERPHGRRRPGEEQPDDEQGDRGEERLDRADAVGDGAGRDHADDAHGERAGEGEGVELLAVELGTHERHDRRDGERFERAEEDERAGADGDEEEPTSEDAVVGGVRRHGCRRGLRGGCGHRSEPRTSSRVEVKP
jgi:hypothetical protein